ncbi:unnamed protein product, partial [Musa textilis]
SSLRPGEDLGDRESLISLLFLRPQRRSGTPDGSDGGIGAPVRVPGRGLLPRPVPPPERMPDGPSGDDDIGPRRRLLFGRADHRSCVPHRLLPPPVSA